MIHARVLYGTESGNAEMVADEVASTLAEQQVDVSPEELSDVDVSSLQAGQFVFLICSTYEEGDLPASAQPFFETLSEGGTDLSGVHFFPLGLGDTSYEFYGRAIDTLSGALEEAGAVRMSDVVKHDALSGVDPARFAAEWASSQLISLVAPAR